MRDVLHPITKIRSFLTDYRYKVRTYIQLGDDDDDYYYILSALEMQVLLHFLSISVAFDDPFS